MSYPDAKGVWVTAFPEHDQPAQVHVTAYEYGVELGDLGMIPDANKKASMKYMARIIMTFRMVDIDQAVVFPLVWAHRMPNTGLMFWLQNLYEAWEEKTEEETGRFLRVEGRIYGPDPLPNWQLFGYPKLPKRYNGLPDVQVDGPYDVSRIGVYPPPGEVWIRQTDGTGDPPPMFEGNHTGAEPKYPLDTGDYS